MISAFIVSCESNTYNEIAEVNTNPTYTKNIEPVVKANCLSCHSGNSQFPNLETYEEVKLATQSGELICRISNSCGSIMPPSGALPTQTIETIKLWQTQGYTK